MKVKLLKQIAILSAVAASFTAILCGIWFFGTARCLPDNGKVVKARVISLERYLPFDENSEIVKIKGALPWQGEVPVLDGAEGLYPVFSAAVHALYPKESVIFDGEGFTAESKLQMNNTLRAYRGVVDGTVDIAFCAGPSEAQLQYAEEKGVELAFVPIGREAFVFLVHKDNPVNSLTVEEVRGIYSGKYNNWRLFGGKDIPIAALTRLEGSGSQSALVAFMKGEPIAKDYDVMFGSAIGFSFRYYVSDVIANGRVKMLALNGIYPSRENIMNGTYPVVSPFYAVYDKANSNPNVALLIDWLLSDEGQMLIAETGYIPLSE